MRVRKDQKGFTIVEVLIASAILAIVVLTVCAFIMVGSRSYAAGNSDINVQQEAQLALNQMSDVLIDTTRSVNYVGYDTSGNPVLALKDAEFTFTPEDKSLVMYNGVVEETAPAVPGGATSQTVDPGNGNKHYHFYWSKENETLYYAELKVQPTDVDTSAIHFPAFDPADPVAAGWVELASHVTDFSVDLSQVEEKRVVQLALTFVDGTKEYVTSNNVTIRNKVGVNDAELAPLNKKKTLSVAARDSGVIIEPGETYHFSTPKVTGENVADRSVKWSVASAKSASGNTRFTDDVNGILHVATDEPAGTITVTITTNAVDSDGNHASCSVSVDIKRVTSVNLTTDADNVDGVNLVSPGSTFTVFVNSVGGNKIGKTCSVCGDDTAIDEQVSYQGNPYGLGYIWRVYNPSQDSGLKPGDPGYEDYDPTQYVKIVESAADHATFRVESDAPNNEAHGFTIQAVSLLSLVDNADGRHYDGVPGIETGWVPGAISFKMKKEDKKNIGVDGTIRWGVKVGLWAEIDYPPGFNSAGQGYFLICARVREEGTTGGDKIMIYRTTGMNSEVTPDMFGVEDISKPWYLSLQVLDPGRQIQQGVGPSAQLLNDLSSQIWDPTVKDVVADYLANCDASGTYVGTKYPHTGKFEGRILPPEIYYSYDGQSNLGGELRLKTVSTLAGPETTEFHVDYVKNTRDERDRNHFTNRSVKFSAYKEENGKLTPIYCYNAGGNYYEGNSQPYNGALRFDEIQSATNTKIKLDFNRKDSFAQAAGKYRIIPTINYYQDPGADTSYTIYYANYQPNYWSTQTYEVPESTVYYELKNGGNLELWSYYNNEFTKGEIYFPTPSELSTYWASPSNFDYYFNISDLQNDLSWHDAKQLNTFQKIVKDSSNNQIYYQASSIRGRYVKDKNVYQLELFYKYWDSTWNMEMEVSAGVFQCAADGERWEQIERGTFDSQLGNGNKKPQVNATANVDFKIGDQRYEGKMYIPLPSEKLFSSSDNNGFGFTPKQSGEQSRDWKRVKFQQKGQTNTQDVEFARLTCTYDLAADTYILKGYDRNYNLVVTFTCKSNGKKWEQP